MLAFTAMLTDSTSWLATAGAVDPVYRARYDTRRAAATGSVYRNERAISRACRSPTNRSRTIDRMRPLTGGADEAAGRAILPGARLSEVTARARVRRRG